MLAATGATTSSNWVLARDIRQRLQSKGGPVQKRPRGLQQRIAVPYSFTSKNFDLNPFDPLQFLVVSKVEKPSGFQNPSNKALPSQETRGFSERMTKSQPFIPKYRAIVESGIPNNSSHVGQSGNRWLSYHQSQPEEQRLLEVQGKQVTEGEKDHAQKPAFRLKRMTASSSASSSKKVSGPGPHPVPHLATTSFTRMAVTTPRKDTKPVLKPALKRVFVPVQKQASAQIGSVKNAKFAPKVFSTLAITRDVEPLVAVAEPESHHKVVLEFVP